MEFILILLFVLAVVAMIFSLVKLHKLPKEDKEKRLPFKILLGFSIFVLVVYLLSAAFVLWIISQIAIHGM